MTETTPTEPGKFLGEVRAVPFAHHMPDLKSNIVRSTVRTVGIRLVQWNGTEWVLICELP